MNSKSIDRYEAVYEVLGELREHFHKSGRLDDSNAKLDEIAKLIATRLAFERGLIPDFPATRQDGLIEKLQAAFLLTASLPGYALEDGHSIFGRQPSLILRAGDEELAESLVKLVDRCVSLATSSRINDHSFDVLNETFGHFVRDNFRGNVEDAQYMTPPEVVDFVIDLAAADLSKRSPTSRQRFVVLDPTCGVGSFLASFYHRNRQAGWIPASRLVLLGQDKVERMARLATINLELFDVAEHRITVGNSLTLGGALDDCNDGVDLILTNPPFGARFDAAEVRDAFGGNTPFFSNLAKRPSSLDSELLFIDRNMRLLKDGGHMAIVIPDGVISAKGTAALLRQHLGQTATIKAIVELPAVTFAQAGTRTKTSVLYLRKGARAGNARTLLAIATELGFQVAARKGVQIKQVSGTNQLPAILDAYRASLDVTESSAEPVVLSESPSCVSLPEAQLLRSSWTASHYSASRLMSVESAKAAGRFTMVPLSQLVDFCGDARRAKRWQPGMAFLSVLHVIGEGFIDLAGVAAYSPKTPGVPTEPGDILISRINPRIPRVCITPDFDRETLCSSEFEVMRAKPGVDPHLLVYLLLSAPVQDQVRSLTSGTSASHNRIRTSELSNVLVPVPAEDAESARLFDELASAYREAVTELARQAHRVFELRSAESILLG